MNRLTGNPKTFVAVLGALVLGALPLPALATTATSLSSFEGIEEPTDRVSQSLVVTPGDTYDNITEPSSGTFRFELRYGDLGRGEVQLAAVGCLAPIGPSMDQSA